MCAEYRQGGHGNDVARRSGLPVDPMFSATKARWLLDAADPHRSRALRGELCLGTVDSWLLARLGSGTHVIEVGNASRTQLLNIDTLSWDPTLLDLFGVPRQVLPDVVPSTGPFPVLDGIPGLGPTPITAVMGDSHAALFAQAGWAHGHVKVTYGTGTSVMMLSADGRVPPPGLCRTVAWADPTPAYALEGNIRSSGATLTWLARTFSVEPTDLAEFAADASSDGVHLVPGFSGLAAPHWDPDAVGLISGISFGTGLPQLARAALESIAFQIDDVLCALDRSTIATVLADGGASRNSVLMQIQADLSGIDVLRATDADLSALGAAHLAGLNGGFWTKDDLADLLRRRDRFTPRSTAEQRAQRSAEWRVAVRRSRGLPLTTHDES
jgi:glycerol kinase